MHIYETENAIYCYSYLKRIILFLKKRETYERRQRHRYYAFLFTVKMKYST